MRQYDIATSDGWVVAFGTVRRGLGDAPPRSSVAVHISLVACMLCRQCRSPCTGTDCPAIVTWQSVLSGQPSRSSNLLTISSQFTKPLTQNDLPIIAGNFPKNPVLWLLPVGRQQPSFDHARGPTSTGNFPRTEKSQRLLVVSSSILWRSANLLGVACDSLMYALS